MPWIKKVEFSEKVLLCVFYFIELSFISGTGQLSEWNILHRLDYFHDE